MTQGLGRRSRRRWGWMCLCALLLACAPRREPSRAPAVTAPQVDQAEDADTVLLRFDPVAMQGARCRVAATAELFDDLTTISDVDFGVDTVEGTLRLRVYAAFVGLQNADGFVSQQRFTPEGIEQYSRGMAPTRREVAEDPGAKRLIDDLLGNPHVFVRLDEHAVPRDVREDFPAWPDLEQVVRFGENWLDVVSELPDDRVRVGATWTRVRRMPDTPNGGLRLDYLVRSIEVGVATIDIHAEGPEMFPFAGDVEVTGEVRGSTRLRIADGFFLEGERRMRMLITAKPGEPQPPPWEFHTRASCVPAPAR